MVLKSRKEGAGQKPKKGGRKSRGTEEGGKGERKERKKGKRSSLLFSERYKMKGS